MRKETNADKPTACIRFKVEDETGEPFGETMWAYNLGRDRYKVANLPFFVYGVSAHDIVLAPYDRRTGLPTFERVIIKSGNRTLRAGFSQRVSPGNRTRQVLDKLIEMGCGIEGADGSHFAFNVPATVELGKVAAILDRTAVIWELSDPEPA